MSQSTWKMRQRRAWSAARRVMQHIAQNPDCVLPYGEGVLLPMPGQRDMGYCYEKRGTEWREVSRYLPVAQRPRGISGITIGAYRDLVRSHTP